jgi:NitT/TauT family transport system substrate-binding protein
MHPSISVTTALIAAAMLSLSSGAAAGAAEITDTLRYGLDDEKNISRLPQVVAERKGFFAREGLNVEIVRLTSSFREPLPGANPAGEREAMRSGLVNMTRQQLPLLINDSIEGEGGYIGVGIAASNPMYFLAVRPEIASFADLAGKTVAVTGPHDGITLWTRELMELHGLSGDEFETTRIAGSGARVNCLASGECAAAVLAQPAIFRALDAGQHIIGTTNEIGPLLYQFDIVNPDWAAANRETVVKYLRATAAASRYILDPNNREEIVAITMDYMEENEDRTRQMLSYFWQPENRVLQDRAAFDMDNIRATIALMGKYGILTAPLPAPETYADPSYAIAADQ